MKKMTWMLLVLSLAFFACEEEVVDLEESYDSFDIQTVMSVATALDANPEIIRMIPGSDDKAVFIASGTLQLFPITYTQESFTIETAFNLNAVVDSSDGNEEMTSIDVSQPIDGVNYVAILVAKTDCAKGSVILLNFNTGEVVKRIDDIGYNPDGCAFTKNSTHLIIACEDDREDRSCKPDERHGGSVSIINLEDGIANAYLEQDYLVNYETDSEPEHAETNANGDVVVSVQEPSHILVFNVADLPLEAGDITTIVLPTDEGGEEAQPDGLYISPDGKYALISSEGNGTLQMMDIASATMLGTPHIIENDLPSGWYVDADKSEKRTEPEECALIERDGKLYAVLALQESHGVIVYDVTNPAAPVFDSIDKAGILWEDDVFVDGVKNSSVVGSEGLAMHQTNGICFSANEREGSITMYTANWARD